MAEQCIATGVAVVGGGPGGYAAAFMAADLGLDVTIVELDPNPGGTCLYRGCIPSKALLHAAKILSEAREAAAWGIEFEKPKIDLDKLRTSTENVVKKLTGGVGQLCKARKIRFIQGRARFVDSASLHVDCADGSETTLQFKHSILATGSVPIAPANLRLDSPRMMDSTDALALENIPESLLVVGGGYIGLELTSVYGALGSKVTVVEMTPGLLPGADPDLVKPLAKRIATVCHEIRLNTKVLSVAEKGTGLAVTLEDPGGNQDTRRFSKVLVSVGRRPNSGDLGLENTNVSLDGHGFVQVDVQRRTTDPHIFAIGDLTGQPMLAHKATHEGQVAAEVIAGKNVAFEPRAIPAVVFTDPEIAWCGLTELEAKAQKRDVKIARFPWAASGRASTLHREEGLTKIIADPETFEILGVGIVGPGAGELIAEGTLAIEMGALASDLHLTIHPHPTMSETIMECAELIFGRSTHLYRKR